MEGLYLTGGAIPAFDPPEDGFPYLEPIELDRGGYKARDVVHACGTSNIKFRGTESDKRFFKRMYCMKAFCPKCNRKRGRLERRRVQAVYKRLPKRLAGIFLRQWVFTVPASLRGEVKTKDRLNQLTRSVTRIIKQFYGGKGWIDYIHLVGEKGEFAPHINVHIPEYYKDAEGNAAGEKWVESQERIDQINARWRMALTGIIGHTIDIENSVVHYSFRKTRRHMMHAIRYMARASFDYQEDMIDFIAEDLKGFQFVRFGGIMRNGKYKDAGLSRAEMEKAAGERLEFIDIITTREIDMMYMAGDLEEIAPGLYRETDKAYYQRTHKKPRG